jgi:predicted phosphoribosyltransferase
VAEALGAPLDVIIVRKLGVPRHPELAMGAIASGGYQIFNEDVISRLGIPRSDIEAVTKVERKNLEERETRYRGERSRQELEGKVVILVDDGLATGATMRAAIRAVREAGPQSVAVAVPTGANETCRKVAKAADDFIVLVKPVPFMAVGQSYKDFSPVMDTTVEVLLGSPPPGD